MGHYEKLYEKIKNNPKNVRFDEIDKLLVKVGGFNRTNPKGGSSHYTYSHPDLDSIITIPKREKPVKTIYIKKALKYLNRIKEEL